VRPRVIEYRYQVLEKIKPGLGLVALDFPNYEGKHIKKDCGFVKYAKLKEVC